MVYLCDKIILMSVTFHYIDVSFNKSSVVNFWSFSFIFFTFINNTVIN